MPVPGFSTTAPIDIASQFSRSGEAHAEQSSALFAKQKTGQSNVSAKQMLAAMRIIVASYQLATSAATIARVLSVR